MREREFFRRGLVAMLGEAEDDPAQPIVFRVAGREFPGEAVFQDPFTVSTIGNTTVTRATPTLVVDGPKWDAYGLARGAHVTVHGREYEIVDVERDESNTVVAALRGAR